MINIKLRRQEAEAAIDALLAMPNLDNWGEAVLESLVIGCGMFTEDTFSEWLDSHTVKDCN